MVKKGLCVLLGIVMLFTLSGCADILGGAVLGLAVIATADKASKREIVKFVNKNEEALLEAIEAGEYSAFENQGFINDVRADHKVVVFDCGGAGIGSGTSCAGFYYTYDGAVAAVECAPSATVLKPEGDGFAWQEYRGDNRYYTEHICGNFYYYEASY